MISLIFNQYDLSVPGGPIGVGTGGRLNRILSYPVDGEPIRTASRRRVLSFSLLIDEVDTELRRRNLDFAEVLIVDTELRRRRLAFDEGVRLASSEPRRRTFEDDRDLIVGTGLERSRKLIFERV